MASDVTYAIGQLVRLKLGASRPEDERLGIVVGLGTFQGDRIVRVILSGGTYPVAYFAGELRPEPELRPTEGMVRRALTWTPDDEDPFVLH